ncbi:uncharacterized protein LOC141628985 [Silene latifolia]|uniref:uncharacterized protein LOC141628985 n=1 Tax=Silene latifolia TaxID=37657 RepID=UPI003D77740A
MSVFKLPGFFCDELKSLVLNFWWGAENGRKKIPWVAWEKLCRSKDNGGLGFRDFRLFNKALLGKQGWRLMTEDTSLMARVLKGKYFADRDFLEAELGSNPSFTWRSIWESKDVILSGARRRVGDGWSTKVWLDPWIPNTQSRRVLSPRNGSDISLKVAQLMNDDYNGWNEELIGALFLPFEQERIRTIRISDIKPMDDWCWDHTKDGQYSGCGWVSGVWEGVGLEKKVDIWAERVREWVEGVMREGDEKERKVFMLSCWAIWESRNAAIFEGKGRHCELVICRVQEMLREMDEAEGSRRREEGEGGCRGAGWNRKAGEGVDIGGNGREVAVDRGVWRGPVEGVVKINTDAGVAEGMGTGLGVVARNSSGELLWAAVLQNRMVGEAKNAEAEAILFGMKEAWSRGHMSIMMESDCQAVIKDLREKKKGRADIFRIYDDIFHLRSSFNSVEFSFVRRESNRVAHLLAHSSPWLEGKRIWSDNAPQNIIDAIFHDINEMI